MRPDQPLCATRDAFSDTMRAFWLSTSLICGAQRRGHSANAWPQRYHPAVAAWSAVFATIHTSRQPSWDCMKVLKDQAQHQVNTEVEYSIPPSLSILNTLHQSIHMKASHISPQETSVQLSLLTYS